VSAAMWLRAGLFKVDEWADRIYVYERDAPGTFSTVAYYGRGWEASLVGSLKIRNALADRGGESGRVQGSDSKRVGRQPVRHSLFLRGSVVMYPWNLSDKPGRWEVKVQWVMEM